LRCCQSQ